MAQSTQYESLRHALLAKVAGEISKEEFLAEFEKRAGSNALQRGLSVARRNKPHGVLTQSRPQTQVAPKTTNTINTPTSPKPEGTISGFDMGERGLDYTFGTANKYTPTAAESAKAVDSAEAAVNARLTEKKSVPADAPEVPGQSQMNSHNQPVQGNGTITGSSGHTISGGFSPWSMLGGLALGTAGMTYLNSPNYPQGYAYGYPPYGWR